jgi:DNA polymerase (family 10)
MINAEVSRLFNEIADLLDLSGEDSFRVSSYRRAARSIDDLTGDLAQIERRGELDGVPGIGKSTASKIREYLATGRIALREELAGRVPATLLELLRIPNLGPKKAALLWKQRGITSLADLKRALESGALVGLKGFAERSIEQLREGIAFLERAGRRTPLGEAWPLAEALREAVAKIRGVRRVETAGSLRRGCETVGDLDLLCVAEDGERVVSAFTQLPGVQRVLVAGGTKGSVLVGLGGERQMQVDLRVVPAESFGAAWQYFTGSKEHNVRLRELAGRRGWTLNEYALSEIDGGRVIASTSEEEIYSALGVPCVPPEMREDRGELDLQAVPADLLAPSDIRGDLHMHTVASDGRCTVEELIAAAQRLGYEYICITDHSQSSVIAGGLTPERLEQHMAHVRDIAKRTRGLKVWVGAEVDIHADGSLDYPDDLLAQLDWVVASVHVGMSRDQDANTRRTLAAIRNPYVNVIGHPTGRLLGRRDAMPLDVEAVAREAARTGTALEINASVLRLDLRDQHARLARDAGALLCIDTDAHDPQQLEQMRYGVTSARRAWLRKGDVLNTRKAADVSAFVRAKSGPRAQ